MNRVIGSCSLCGGSVSIPTMWWSVEPPVPTCDSCYARAQPQGPVIPMVKDSRLEDQLESARRIKGKLDRYFQQRAWPELYPSGSGCTENNS